MSRPRSCGSSAASIPRRRRGSEKSTSERLARLPPCCSESASASKSKVGCEALASRPPKRVKKVHSRDASVGSPPGRGCSLERAEAPARAMRTWHAAMSVSTYEDMPPLKASLSPRARRKALSASTSGASSGSSRCMASTAPTASKPLVEPTDTSAAMPFRNTSLMMGTRALDITCALDTSLPERKRLASLKRADTTRFFSVDVYPPPALLFCTPMPSTHASTSAPGSDRPFARLPNSSTRAALPMVARQAVRSSFMTGARLASPCVAACFAQRA
mmetsp:Transcript_1418/g.5623  ORF Transcript_1418/g.5623 Transcript_1418/m.5623 type:complete len:275 (-) Transcript_1418:669-1493(-)